MTSSPQPMEVRRRTGSKRGDHGTYVAPTAAGPAAAAAADASDASIGHIRRYRIRWCRAPAT